MSDDTKTLKIPPATKTHQLLVCLGADLKLKNSHILPTGQWYAPSAVSNDALILPEYARACQSMQEYARVC